MGPDYKTLTVQTTQPVVRREYETEPHEFNGTDYDWLAVPFYKPTDKFCIHCGGPLTEVVVRESFDASTGQHVQHFMLKCVKKVIKRWLWFWTRELDFGCRGAWRCIKTGNWV
jgi:hypothetical protein